MKPKAIAEGVIKTVELKATFASGLAPVREGSSETYSSGVADANDYSAKYDGLVFDVTCPSQIDYSEYVNGSNWADSSRYIIAPKGSDIFLTWQDKR
ncbi:MAG: hypothetical protein FWF42_01910 [Streptococcaceae bacterium]|nr:hypothetical protein [Streptococcaceae bacterium]